MKKVLLISCLSLTVFGAKSQAILLSENFDSYNGLVTSIPPGFYISWNDTAALSRSYYFTTGFCGVACNSYKFGVDSATIITPTFSNPGSVSFYLKGNGNFNNLNHFQVYESPNGSTWNLVISIDSIPSASQTVSLNLNSSTTQLKFFFIKDTLGYNAGFDDLIIYGPTSINELKGLQAVSVFPSPSTGLLTVNFYEKYYNQAELSVINILGKEVKHFSLKGISSKYTMDLSDLPDGIYLLKIKSGNEEMIKRIILKK